MLNNSFLQENKISMVKPAKNADDPIETMLKYCPNKDLSSLDIDRPMGEVTDWDEIIAQLDVETSALTKIGYIITFRLPEMKKDNNNTRVKFTDPQTAEGGDKKNYLYISFPTDTRSVARGEITVGRFRTMTTGVLGPIYKDKGLIPPVLSVTGFQNLLTIWAEAIAPLVLFQTGAPAVEIITRKGFH